MKHYMQKLLYCSFILLAVMACEKDNSGTTDAGDTVGGASTMPGSGVVIGGGNTCQPEFPFDPNEIYACSAFATAADEDCYECPADMETKKLFCLNPSDVDQMTPEGKKACQTLGASVTCIDSPTGDKTLDEELLANSPQGHKTGQIICVPSKGKCENGKDKDGNTCVE